MLINLKGDNLEITEEHDRLIFEKLDQGLEKYLRDFNPDLKVADVMLSKHPREGYIVNFAMVLPGKKRIYAESSSRKLQTAVTALRAKVARQLQGYRADIGASGKQNRPLKELAREAGDDMPA